MSFSSNILSYSPSILLSFNKDGRVDNLVPSDIVHEFLGAPPLPVLDVITPSSGDFGGGLLFDSDPINSISGSSAYRIRYTAAHKAQLRPEKKITVILCCNKPKYQRYAGLISCTQSGGWNVEINTPDIPLTAIVRANNGYLKAEAPPSFVFDDNSNLIVMTYDGQVLTLYNNGEIVAQADGGLVADIQYSNSIVHITIGAEPGTSESYNGFPGLGVEYAAIVPNLAITSTQVQTLYDDFSTSYQISGRLIEEDGTAGKVVRVSSWYSDTATKKETNDKTINITPSVADGSWVAKVPDGTYQVVMIGAANSAPIVHGPIKPR